MKKLIAISVVFALVAGVAFAVDVSGTVIGTVNVIQFDTDKDKAGDPTPIGASAELSRIRLEGSGEVGDGKYGGWVRLDGGSFHGRAWWKPIDQVKLHIGGSGYDGFWGKEGVTGWGFFQTACDTGVTFAGANVWGGGLYGSGIGIGKYAALGKFYDKIEEEITGSPVDPEKSAEEQAKKYYGNSGLTTRAAFYGGFGGSGLILEINPLDMLGINIAVPFFDSNKAEDIYSHIHAQVDLKLSFGNIALTFVGGKGHTKAEAAKYGEWKAIKSAAGTNMTAAEVWTEYWTRVNKDKAEANDKDASAKVNDVFEGKYYLDNGVYKPYPEYKATPSIPSSPDPYPTYAGVLPGTTDLYERELLKDEVKEADDPSKFYLYFGLTAIENLGIDFGVCYTLPSVWEDFTVNNPIGIGLGVKYAAGAFGIKFRTVLSFGESVVPKVGDTQEGGFDMLLEINPYFAVNDSARIYLNAGIGLSTLSKKATDDLDAFAKFAKKDIVTSQVGWHVNPYVEIGEEWGPKFLAGIKVWSPGLGIGAEKSDAAIVNFAIPIALIVSF